MPNSSDFNRFAVNPVNVDIQRSLFNMEHTCKFTAQLGEITPFEVRECLPGDTFTCETTKVIRIQPLVAPIMDEIICDTYYFFVPNRLVWNHWKEFMGENNSSPWAPQVTYSIPQLTAPSSTGMNIGTIWDYFGLPTSVDNISVSALPFRAYAKIVNDWFVSEAVNTPVNVSLDDNDRTASNGNTFVTDVQLGGKPFIAAKLFDYFTGCLPSPQKGDAVNVSLLGQAPVYALSKSYIHAGDSPFEIGGKLINPMGFITLDNTTHKFRNSSIKQDVYLDVTSGTAAGGNDFRPFLTKNASITPTQDSNWNTPNNLWADLTNLSAFTINDLRIAFAVQRYLEKSARYGSRYIEMIKAFFNVDSPDARLQRSEYLGGSRLPLNINSIHQTTPASSASVTDALARPAGISVTGEVNSDFTYSCTEHGYIIGVAVFRYHHSYQNGIERFWSRKTMYDFYNPVFANLGEMSVKYSEICATGSSLDDQVFGYQEAWADYRYSPNHVTGYMREDVDGPNLAFWHLGDYYNSAPTLSAAWLAEDYYPLSRALAYVDFPPFMCDFLINMKAARPMPLYSIPGLIDHH